jgi:hypothetical protein
VGSIGSSFRGVGAVVDAGVGVLERPGLGVGVWVEEDGVAVIATVGAGVARGVGVSGSGAGPARLKSSRCAVNKESD